MLDQLNEIEKSALESLADVNDQSALDAWRVANLGRSSPLMQVFSGWENYRRRKNQLSARQRTRSRWRSKPLWRKGPGR